MQGSYLLPEKEAGRMNAAVSHVILTRYQETRHFLQSGRNTNKRKIAKRNKNYTKFQNKWLKKLDPYGSIQPSMMS